MKLIKIAVYEATDGEVVSGALTIQRKRGDTWVVESSTTFVSGTPEAERVLLLEDSQRVVVEASSNKKLVYDRPQAAAVPRQMPPRPKMADVPSDAEESPPVPLSEQARYGDALLAAMQQETRDRLISEARAKLKASRAIEKE